MRSSSMIEASSRILRCRLSAGAEVPTSSASSPARRGLLPTMWKTCRRVRAGLTKQVDRNAMAAIGFFVCDRDLEDELIRALGCRRVELIIEREGELGSLRKLQQMPFHRDRTVEEHLHRFMGVRSGRKYRYAPMLMDALDGSDMPQPVHDLLSYVFDQPRGRTGRPSVSPSHS